jgi:hypothetical protein
MSQHELIQVEELSVTLLTSGKLDRIMRCIAQVYHRPEHQVDILRAIIVMVMMNCFLPDIFRGTTHILFLVAHFHFD